MGRERRRTGLGSLPSFWRRNAGRWEAPQWRLSAGRVDALEGNDVVETLLQGGRLDVGQGKGGLSIASVGGAEEGKQGGILGDGQNLAVAQGPALWREIETDQRNGSHVDIRHGQFSLG